MKIFVLSEYEIERIRTATEEFIEETGFKVQHKGLLKKAKEAGAIVDESAQNVKMPKELFRELLSKVPEKYEASAIDGTKYTIGGGEQYIGAIVTDPWIIDYETKEPRRPSLEDVRINTILSQRNPRVCQISRMDFPVVEYSDKTSSLRSLELHLLNHTKHYSVYAGDLEDFDRWMEIGRLLAPGGELAGSGLMSVAVPVVSPFFLSEINAEYLIKTTENNFTVLPTVCQMTGATAPYSRDSALVQGNIESLFIAAMAQILNPGNPCGTGQGPSISDMHSGQSLYYTLDKVLWKIASIELAKSYRIPCGAECGGTLSHRYDMQSGAESMLFMLAAVNSGMDVLGGIGSCYNANGLSSEMIMIQSAWLEAAEYLSRGIGFDNFEEGVQSLKKQGAGGHFLMDDLTVKNLRSGEFFSSDLFDMSGGYGVSSSMLERAHKKVKELTADYVSPVPGEIQENLRRYFHDLYKRMQT